MNLLIHSVLKSRPKPKMKKKNSWNLSNLDIRWWRIKYFDLIYAWLMISKGDDGIANSTCLKISIERYLYAYGHIIRSLNHIIRWEGSNTVNYMNVLFWTIKYHSFIHVWLSPWNCELNTLYYWIPLNSANEICSFLLQLLSFDTKY